MAKDLHLRNTVHGSAVHQATIHDASFVTLACQPNTLKLKRRYRTANTEPVDCRSCKRAARRRNT